MVARHGHKCHQHLFQEHLVEFRGGIIWGGAFQCYFPCHFGRMFSHRSEAEAEAEGGGRGRPSKCRILK
eukprot:scaffold118784_cov60-Cyclotella_meneghiniana.AAC.5